MLPANALHGLEVDRLEEGSHRVCAWLGGACAIFLVRAAQHDLERIIRKRRAVRDDAVGLGYPLSSSSGSF
jgi:hypothetical protein